VKRTRAGRSDAEMRRQASVRVDFMRWKRQNRAFGRVLGKALERRHKKAHIGNGLFEIAVAGNRVKHDALGKRLRSGGDVQRLRRRRQAGNRPRRRIHPGPRDGRFEKSPKIQRS
jgi:hypothetical protein